MKTVYIAFSDGRERHDPILGVYQKESDAYKRLGKYHRENNSIEDMECDWHKKHVSLMSDEELGHADLNDYSCIIGGVEKYEVN